MPLESLDRCHANRRPRLRVSRRLRGRIREKLEGGVVSRCGAVDGDAAPSAFATFRRPPVTVLPARVGSASTVPSSAALTWSMGAWGNLERYRAAAPLTKGAAIEVPLNAAYPLLSDTDGTVEYTSSPGAP